MRKNGSGGHEVRRCATQSPLAARERAAKAALDPMAYGGYAIAANPQTGWNAKGFAPLASDAPGTYLMPHPQWERPDGAWGHA